MNVVFDNLRRPGSRELRRTAAALGRRESGELCAVLRCGGMLMPLTPEQAVALADSLVDVAEHAARGDG